MTRPDVHNYYSGMFWAVSLATADFDRYFSLTYLSKEAPGHLLFQDVFLSDEIKEVLAGLGPFHDDDEGVVSFEAVQQLDHARNFGDCYHQTHLHRNSFATYLQKDTHNIRN